MTENYQLHVRRLTDAKAQIPTWKAGSENALTPGFSAWQRRVEHSLDVLFGKDHHYSRSFRGLEFWLLRMSVGQSGVHWNARDQERFVADLSEAESVLADALEELPSLPDVHD